MADESKHEVKKHKKKHKKKSKRSDETTEEDNETPNNDASESQTSAKEKTPPPMTQENAKTLEQSQPTKQKLAAKTKIPSHEWTYEEEKRFLKELQKYASQEEKEKVPYNRVEWKQIENMDGISPTELNEEYKKLTKKVRKIRCIREVVEDAIQQQCRSTEKFSTKEKPPSKPSNSFMLFCKAKRPSLSVKHPELNFAQMHKKMCERWREMSHNKRGKYVKKYESARLEYLEELRKFEEKQRAKVKKPLSAFEMWKVERMEDGLEEDQSEGDLKEEWENLATSMKKGWMQAASCEKDRYHSEINSIGNTKVKVVKKKTTEKNTSTSDEAQRKTTKIEVSDEGSESSSNNASSGQKRKLANPSQPAQSPPKKVHKETESSSEEDSSSDEE